MTDILLPPSQMGAMDVGDNPQFGSMPDAPLEFRLAPDTELHREVLGKLKERRDFSRRACEHRWDEWDRVREHQRMYIDLTRSSRLADRSSDSSTPEMPFRNAITIPLSYAIGQTLLTQIMSIYGSRIPTLQIKGVEGGDVYKSWAMEAVVDYDSRQTKLFTILYAMFRDSLWYGNGVLYDSWEVQNGLTTTYEPLMVPGAPPELLRAMLGPLAFTPMRQWGVKKEFQRLQVVDPYNMRPDPRVPFWRLQEGEFFGHKFKIGWNILKQRSDESGPYFNLDELREHGARTHYDTERGGTDPVNPTNNMEREFLRDKKSAFYTCEAMTVDLIPEEWKLGPEPFPMKYQFAWAEDDIIIRAHPMPNDHQEFPYSVAETDPDFEATFSPSQMELIEPAQRFCNWHYNAFVENVVTMLNNRWAYSPRFIEEADLEYGGPGENIRLTNEAVELMLSGEIDNVQQFLFQVPMQDVTEAPYTNMTQYMYQMAQMITGANNPLSGIQLPTERSATEINTIMAKATDRIAISTRLMDENAIEPTVKRWMMNRAQLTRIERYYRMVGERARELNLDTIFAGLAELQGDFDYKVISGIMPEDSARSPMTFINLLQTGGQIPQLQQPGPDGRQLDFRRIFEEIARRSGVENIDQFYMDVQVVPDEQAMAQEQAGNYVPVDSGLPQGQGMLPPGMGG